MKKIFAALSKSTDPIRPKKPARSITGAFINQGVLMSATTLTPYLSFNGNTREAFAFYAKALGAQIDAMMRYADMPPPPEGSGTGCGDGNARPSGEGIMHASLTLPGGAKLFAGDTPPGMQHEGIKGVMLALQYATVDEAHSAFAALSQGGQVTMPLMPAFWAKTFGMVTDRFGVSWGINGEPLNLPAAS